MEDLNKTDEQLRKEIFESDDDTPETAVSEQVESISESESQEEQEAPQVDELKGVEPASDEFDPKSAYEQLTDKLDVLNNLEYRIKQTESRIGGLQNRLFNQKEEAPVKKDSPKKSLRDDDKVKATLEDLPELEGLIDHLDGQEKVDVEQLTSSIRTEYEQALKAAQQQQQEDLVALFHPDWKEKASTEDFGHFIVRQPLDIQTLANSERGADVVRVLNLFDEYKSSQKSSKVIKEKRNEKLARSTAAKSSPGIKTKSVEDMTDEEFRRYEFSKG